MLKAAPNEKKRLVREFFLRNSPAIGESKVMKNAIRESIAGGALEEFEFGLGLGVPYKTWSGEFREPTKWTTRFVYAVWTAIGSDGDGLLPLMKDGARLPHKKVEKLEKDVRRAKLIFSQLKEKVPEVFDKGGAFANNCYRLSKDYRGLPAVKDLWDYFAKLLD